MRVAAPSSNPQIYTFSPDYSILSGLSASLTLPDYGRLTRHPDTMEVRLDLAFENSSTDSHSPSGRLLSPLRIPSPFDLDI